MELDLSEFSLPEMLQATLVLLRERATRHDIALSLEVAPEIGTISADERKVKQVLLNLLSNALKFTERGEVRVCALFDSETQQCRLEVSDTGIGIAPEDQELVFQEFSQIANTLQQRAKAQREADREASAGELGKRTEEIRRSLDPISKDLKRVSEQVQQLEHLLRFRRFGEAGEAAQVAEQRGDIAAVALQNAFIARRDDELGKRRGQKTL